MEADQYSRIIFISIVDLQKIRFSKLEQVCDRVYVFVDKDAKVVPFHLVQQLQHLGESVKWVAVNGKTPEVMSNYITFFMGQLHEQMDKEVEFAIISESASMDHLIQYINEKGRSCIRVTKNKEKEVSTGDINGISWSTPKKETAPPVSKPTKEPTPIPLVKEEKEKTVAVPARAIANGNGSTIASNGTTTTRVVSKEKVVDKTTSALPDKVARETIKRLVLSGNRPEALESLKSYILLQYNSQEVNQQIDSIIDKMEKTNDIKVQNEEVVYNF